MTVFRPLHIQERQSTSIRCIIPIGTVQPVHRHLVAKGVIYNVVLRCDGTQIQSLTGRSERQHTLRTAAVRRFPARRRYRVHAHDHCDDARLHRAVDPQTPRMHLVTKRQQSRVAFVELQPTNTQFRSILRASDLRCRRIQFGQRLYVSWYEDSAGVGFVPMRDVAVLLRLCTALTDRRGSSEDGHVPRVLSAEVPMTSTRTTASSSASFGCVALTTKANSQERVDISRTYALP